MFKLNLNGFKGDFKKINLMNIVDKGTAVIVFSSATGVVFGLISILEYVARMPEGREMPGFGIVNNLIAYTSLLLLNMVIWKGITKTIWDRKQKKWSEEKI